ncbi:S-adenosylmethionine decarboxylase family protein [Mucilaginibacter terrae]|uniref:S-adenosylmethionine decarboxylase family protein n=1 Tax=Mucilaginibacter terrae TaxID=1955052 RepID=UPI003645C09D
MPYKPGLHILAEFTTAKTDYLTSASPCRDLFDQLVSDFELTKVGEAYHEFENGGFTGIICLTESHLSIHTWPEFNLATFDIFLSNYQKDNTEKVKQFYAEVFSFFEGVEIQKNELER